MHFHMGNSEREEKPQTAKQLLKGRKRNIHPRFCSKIHSEPILPIEHRHWVKVSPVVEEPVPFFWWTSNESILRVDDKSSHQRYCCLKRSELSFQFEPVKTAK